MQNIETNEIKESEVIEEKACEVSLNGGDVQEYKILERKKRKEKNFNNLAFLYVLRFILAVSIVLWHCPFAVADKLELHPFLFSLRAMTMYGGNQAFMLISGMMFYLAYYHRLTSDELKTTVFLKKRATRIYPAVIVSILVSYILSLIIYFNLNPEENINLIDLIKDMFFFGARLFGGAYGIYNGPIWFLSALCVAYLLSAFIIVVTKKKKSVYWFLIPLFISFFTELGSNFIVPGFYFKAIAVELFNFYLGFFFMIFLTKFKGWHNVVKIPLRLICLSVSVVFLYAFYKTETHSPLGNGEMIGNLFCWIPLITSLYDLKLNIIFDNVVFKTLGGMSFHLYAWHSVVFKMWQVHYNLQEKPLLEGTLSSLFTFLICVLVVSVISYVICELFCRFKLIDKLKIKLVKLNN